jgi:hypothetical protein
LRAAAVGPTIVIVAEADFVVSVTDVAVSVTVFPLGTPPGAVYVVAVPLAVCAVATEPHDAPPQVTVHFTPPLAESLFTFAVILVTVLIVSGLGGGGARNTEMGGAVIVIVAVAVFEVSVTDVAVTVTVFPVGTVSGAR